MYQAGATFVLALHTGFVLWVIFGAFFTRGRPLLTCVHIASFIWGFMIEIFPWTCPLTFVENWLEGAAGMKPYHGGFLLHYLDQLVYPSVPPLLLTCAAAAVFVANVLVYWRRWRREAG